MKNAIIVSMNNTCIKTSNFTYSKVAGEVRLLIKENGLKGGDFVGSELEFARQNGVSRVSVRRAIDSLIEDGLVERQPGKGVFVRELNTTSRLVQIVVPNIAYDQCVNVTRGVKSEGATKGVLAQIYDAHGNMDADIEMLRELPNSQFHGAVILALHHPAFNEAICALKLAKYPFVLVDGCMDGIDIPSVQADNYQGGYKVGYELIKLGHKRIGFIGYLEANTVKERLNGLRDAVNDAELPFDRSLVKALNVSDPLDDWTGLVDDATKEIMQQPDCPTAIFYSSDVLATYGYKALQDIGLRIPDDISVVGFDGDSLCQWLSPKLATVRQPSEDIGRLALILLQKQISGERMKAENHLLPIDWVPGDSIAEPRYTK